MFWADKLTEDLRNIKRTERVDDMFTPSGEAHIGSLRGLIIHGIAGQALKEAEKKTHYTFVMDDFDPMDGIPSYLDEKVYKKFMGLPLYKIPSPRKGESLASYFAKNFLDIIHKLGFEVEIIWNSQNYLSGKMNNVIKTALDNAAKIREIYKKASKSSKSSDWYPFQSICEKCGKLGTTRVYDWKGKEVFYICEKDLVTWAQGCGYKGKASPFDGNGKLSWKVEWPAKWKVLKITIEGEGKDHAVSGGSRDIANALCKEVFNINPPYDIPYEHVLIGGKKMSSSKGLGFLGKDIIKILPPEIIRFMMIRNPRRAIDFDVGGVTIPNLFDEYDRATLAAKGEIDFPDLARTLHFSQIKKFEGFTPRFIKIVYSIQMPRIDVFKEAEVEKGSRLTKEEINELEKRIRYARKWLKVYAPEQFKFEVQQKLPSLAKDLSKEQISFLKELLDVFEKKKDWNGEELHSRIHEIKNDLGISPKEVFSAIYLVFLGKDSGPQAGWLIASLDYVFVKKRLKEGTNR